MVKVKNKSDSKLVEHARRELNMCKAFEKNGDYNGEMGRGILAMVKVFSDWFSGNSQMANSAADGFMRLLNGELLSPPTTDPEEWDPVEGADVGTVRNKRNAFFVSTDNGKTWMHLQSKERGNSRDHITGKDPEDGSGQQGQSDSGRVPSETAHNGNVGGKQEVDGDVTGEARKPIGHVEATEDSVPPSDKTSASADQGSGEGPAESARSGREPTVAAEGQEGAEQSEDRTEKPKTRKA